MYKVIKLLIFILVFSNSYVFGQDIEFTPVKGGRADIGDKENDFGIFVKFNSLSIGYSNPNNNRDSGTTNSRLTMFGLTYRYDGRDISFNALSSGGYTSETKENNVIVNGGSSYVIDGGADLNYIIINKDKIFFSAGLAGIGYIGGIFIDRLNKKRGDVGIINTLGIDTRATFYPLDELYFTGYIGFGFISLYSRSLTGGGGTTDYTLSSSEVDVPIQFSLNGRVYYRPLPTFSVGTGLGFSSITYKDSTTKEKYSFSNFYPYISIDFLF